ncbi:MAG: hypothetical protein E6K78_03750 [Candidatus Eisenbacteria bacterium]|uniref:Uncharacterized protein n=1 Tax=Eiseniibacteriota bacterium TaxID=2212470 RepID=A0A538TVU3_UNCEI|nr:MAG: hypothetical protein E6K78_03750 [Candidatus Eisenbacteria bacterium]
MARLGESLRREKDQPDREAAPLEAEERSLVAALKDLEQLAHAIGDPKRATFTLMCHGWQKTYRFVDSRGKAPPLRYDDPLHEVTRQERRSLLVVRFIALLISRAGLLLAKIEGFGLEFPALDPRWLLSSCSILRELRDLSSEEFARLRVRARERIADHSTLGRPLAEHEALYEAAGGGSAAE